MNYFRIPFAVFASSEPVPGFQGDTLQLAFIDLRQVQTSLQTWLFLINSLLSGAEGKGGERTALTGTNGLSQPEHSYLQEGKSLSRSGVQYAFSPFAPVFVCCLQFELLIWAWGA